MRMCQSVEVDQAIVDLKHTVLPKITDSVAKEYCECAIEHLERFVENGLAFDVQITDDETKHSFHIRRIIISTMFAFPDGTYQRIENNQISLTGKPEPDDREWLRLETQLRRELLAVQFTKMIAEQIEPLMFKESERV